MIQDLKKCPFCGGHAAVLSDKWKNDIPYYFAGCLNCGIRTAQMSDRLTVIKVWNRRREEICDG